MFNQVLPLLWWLRPSLLQRTEPTHTGSAVMCSNAFCEAINCCQAKAGACWSEGLEERLTEKIHTNTHTVPAAASAAVTACPPAMKMPSGQKAVCHARLPNTMINRIVAV